MTPGADRPPRRVVLALAGWVAAVGVLTLLPVDARQDRAGGATDGGVHTIDALANVVLFVPGGVLGAASTGARAGVVVAGAGLSAAIEGTQTVVPGRRPHVVDFAANTAGTLFGMLLWMAWARLGRRGGDLAAQLERASWGLFVAGHLAAVVLWSPSPAFPDGTWSAEIASERRLGLPAGTARARFTATDAGDEPTVLADSTDRGRELVRLYRAGDALVLRSRVLARDLDFLQRSLRVEGSPGRDASGYTGETSGVLTLRPGETRVRTTSPNGRTSVARWSLDDLWALVVPAGRMGGATKIALQWLFAISAVAPVFVFAAVGGSGVGGLAARVLGTGAVVVGLPLLFGQPLFDLRLHLGTGLGAGVGAALGWWWRSRPILSAEAQG